MTPNDIIRSNTGYELRVLKYIEVNKLPIAVVESMDSVQPFALMIGLRKLPNGRCVWDRATWFANKSSAFYEYDVEKTNRKMERYA
jgi:hypothetical protein